MAELTTPLIGEEAYNDFSQFSELSYTCIKYLMNNNELVWKLLKYTEPDAWNFPDLTQAEKGALIYAGQQDTSQFNVFMDGMQPDVEMKEKTMLRIMPSYAVGLNRTLGYIELSMQVFSHYKINHMTNYKTRIDVIIQQLLEVFNGANVSSLGLLAFDRTLDQSSRLFQAGQIPFGGKEVIFATYSA